jgi:hypothetical protein
MHRPHASVWTQPAAYREAFAIDKVQEAGPIRGNSMLDQIGEAYEYRQRIGTGVRRAGVMHSVLTSYIRKSSAKAKIAPGAAHVKGEKRPFEQLFPRKKYNHKEAMTVDNFQEIATFFQL